MKTRFIAALTALVLVFATAFEASARSFSVSRGSFSTSRAFSTPVRTYSAPKPVTIPKTVAPSIPVVKTGSPQVVKQKVTVVQHNTINRTSGGSDFVSSFAGSMAGIAAYNWLFGDDDEEQAQVQEVAEQPAEEKQQEAK